MGRRSGGANGRLRSALSSGYAAAAAADVSGDEVAWTEPRSGAVAGKLKRSLKEQGRVLSARIKGNKTMDKRMKQRRRRA